MLVQIFVWNKLDETPSLHPGLVYSSKDIASYIFGFNSLYAYRANAILATSQEKPHSVAWVKFPVFFDNAQQPAFRYQAIKKGKQQHTGIGGLLQRQSKAHGLGIGLVDVVCIMGKVIAVFILDETPR